MEFVHFRKSRTGVLPKIPPSGKIYNSYSEKGRHLAVAFYKRIITSRGDPITLQIIPQAITQRHDVQLEIRAQNQVSFYEVKLTISPLASSQFSSKRHQEKSTKLASISLISFFIPLVSMFIGFLKPRCLELKYCLPSLFTPSQLQISLLQCTLFFLVLFLKQQDTEASRTHFNLSPCICCVSIKLPFENLVFSFVLT